MLLSCPVNKLGPGLTNFKMKLPISFVLLFALLAIAAALPTGKVPRKMRLKSLRSEWGALQMISNRVQSITSDSEAAVLEKLKTSNPEKYSKIMKAKAAKAAFNALPKCGQLEPEASNGRVTAPTDGCKCGINEILVKAPACCIDRDQRKFFVWEVAAGDNVPRDGEGCPAAA